MREHARSLDPAAAERLLDGASPPPQTETPQTETLARLLSHAAAPGRPHELSGQDAAIAAFRTARAAAPCLGRWRLRSRWRRLLTFKAATAVLGVVTASGLAFASGTGIIPGPFGPDSAPPATPQRSRPASAHPHPTAGPGTRAPTPQPHMPTEALRGLCRAFEDKPASERSKQLEKAAFQDLVRAAGGAHRVDRYCAEALAIEKPDRSHPATPDLPTSHLQAPTPPDQQPQHEPAPSR